MKFETDCVCCEQKILGTYSDAMEIASKKKDATINFECPKCLAPFSVENVGVLYIAKFINENKTVTIGYH